MVLVILGLVFEVVGFQVLAGGNAWLLWYSPLHGGFVLVWWGGFGCFCGFWWLLGFLI